MDEFKFDELFTDYRKFEKLARGFMSDFQFGVRLLQRKPKGIPKQFDMVSEDEQIIGDAKCYNPRTSTPAGELATISEYIWLLQKTDARAKFLIFGGDVEVPKKWLKNFGIPRLIENVQFFFLYFTKSPSYCEIILEELKRENSEIKRIPIITKKVKT